MLFISTYIHNIDVISVTAAYFNYGQAPKKKCMKKMPTIKLIQCVSNSWTTWENVKFEMFPLIWAIINLLIRLMSANVGTNNRTKKKKTDLLTSVFGNAEKNTLLVSFFWRHSKRSSHDNHVKVSLYMVKSIWIWYLPFLSHFKTPYQINTLCILLNNKIHFHMFRNKFQIVLKENTSRAGHYHISGQLPCVCSVSMNVFFSKPTITKTLTYRITVQNRNHQLMPCWNFWLIIQRIKVEVEI